MLCCVAHRTAGLIRSTAVLSVRFSAQAGRMFKASLLGVHVMQAAGCIWALIASPQSRRLCLGWSGRYRAAPAEHSTWSLPRRARGDVGPVGPVRQPLKIDGWHAPNKRDDDPVATCVARSSLLPPLSTLLPRDPRCPSPWT